MELLDINGFSYIIDCVKKEVESAIGPKGKDFCTFLEERKPKMFHNYDTIRNSARTRYLQDHKGLLDRHKCAAAFMVAFLNQVYLEEENIFKETVAIGIGLFILKLFINSQSDENRDPAMAAYIETKGFKFPTCGCDESVYRHNWALGLHYDYRDGKLSILSLANELFMIEAYNRQIAGIS
jgi:hypothetical protein